jgi:hypothetical protein
VWGFFFFSFSFFFLYAILFKFSITFFPPLSLSSLSPSFPPPLSHCLTLPPFLPLFLSLFPDIPDLAGEDVSGITDSGGLHACQQPHLKWHPLFRLFWILAVVRRTYYYYGPADGRNGNGGSGGRGMDVGKGDDSSVVLLCECEEGGRVGGSGRRI